VDKVEHVNCVVCVGRIFTICLFCTWKGALFILVNPAKFLKNLANARFANPAKFFFGYGIPNSSNWFPTTTVHDPMSATMREFNEVIGMFDLTLTCNQFMNHLKLTL
jgi:hypothetical protein